MNAGEMGKATRQKSVDGFVEYWNDGLHVRSQPPANRQCRRHVRAKMGAKVWQTINTSPTSIQFFAHYADAPAQSRRELLDKNYTRVLAENNVLFFRLVYGAMWLFYEGIPLTDLRSCLEECVGNEISAAILEETTRQVGTGGVVKLGTDALGLSPTNIAGANERLKRVLRRRSIGQYDQKSDYEGDLSLALWKCSEGEHLDQSAKALTDSSDPMVAAASLRQILKEQDRKRLRAVILRILRKTIEDLPDIKQDVKNERATSSVLSLDNITAGELKASHESALSNLLNGLTAHGIDINCLSRREMQLLGDELNRRKYGQTRREVYGDEENQRKQAFKNLKNKLGSKP